MFPTVTGKPPPSSPPCAMTASRRLRSSTVPSTARPSWPGCSSAWCRCCGRATLSCWTISPPTKSPVCLTPLKRPAPSCAICRLTVPASIPSNSSSPNSRRCCVKPPPAPSMPCGTPSATCWPPFLPPSAQTTSLMPDTAYLLGKRSSQSSGVLLFGSWNPTDTACPDWIEVEWDDPAPQYIGVCGGIFLDKLTRPVDRPVEQFG